MCIDTVDKHTGGLVELRTGKKRNKKNKKNKNKIKKEENNFF